MNRGHLTWSVVAALKECRVIVAIHDHRTLDGFDRILDVEDGAIRIKACHPTKSD